VFDHCDASTMTVIDTALAQARRLDHDHLGTEHLLLALVQHRDLLPAALAELLPDGEVLASKLAALMGQPPRARDADLLKLVGVDLEEVRANVRQTFGPETVARLGRRQVHQPWQPWRRPSRRCTSLLAGTMSVAPRVKQALELARRDNARELISPLALLIGMIDVEDAMSNRLLRDAGIDPARLRRAARDIA
jgi:ATP-dependent Clp protease ATP-binding subunit ClpA